MLDASLVGGFRGQTGNDINWDVSLSAGERYSEYSPFGFNGAYYYARLSYSFGSAFR